MQQVTIPMTVKEATAHIKEFLSNKGFNLFADIDHRANAQSVDLDMPESRVLIFGNPLGGTKLMQKNLLTSYDLPMRIAIIDKLDKTVILYENGDNYALKYMLGDHPVLNKINGMFEALKSELLLATEA